MNELWADDKAEKLARVLWYLSEEVKAYKDIPGGEPPVLSVLESLLEADDAFEHYLKRIVEDTERAEKNFEFRECMNAMYQAILTKMKNPAGKTQSAKDSDSAVTLYKSPAESLFVAFTLGLAKLPGDRLQSLARYVAEVNAVTQKSALLGVASGALVAVRKTSGSVVVVALAALELGYEAINNIRRWWKGEISGRRCAMSIVDSAISIAAGAAGGLGGAALLGAIGSVAGPAGAIVGAVVGGAVGGVTSANLASTLVGKLTSKIFDLPKSEALERAYGYFGLRQSASNGEITSAYRKRCLEHHPDKGGDLHKFTEVQSNMAIIKASRGDL